MDSDGRISGRKFRRSDNGGHGRVSPVRPSCSSEIPAGGRE